MVNPQTIKSKQLKLRHRFKSEQRQQLLRSFWSILVNQILPRSCILISKPLAQLPSLVWLQYLVKQQDRIRLGEKKQQESIKNYFGYYPYNYFDNYQLNDTCKLILPGEFFPLYKQFLSSQAIGKCIPQSYTIPVLIIQSTHLWQCCLLESSQQKAM